MIGGMGGLPAERGNDESGFGMHGRMKGDGMMDGARGCQAHCQEHMDAHNQTGCP